MATVLLLLAACGPGTNQQKQEPVAIQPGDTCAVCGMYITHYPGPRGEAYIVGRKTPLKFGSTRDFFAYVTRADAIPQLRSLFVQDTARIDWDHPSNAADTFIDARTAYYVAWQPLRGAMGPTLAPFSKRADAEAFIAKHGGQLLRFNQITSKLVSGLGYKCPKSNNAEQGAGGSATTPCVVKDSPSPKQGGTGTRQPATGE